MPLACHDTSVSAPCPIFGVRRRAHLRKARFNFKPAVRRHELTSFLLTVFTSPPSAIVHVPSRPPHYLILPKAFNSLFASLHSLAHRHISSREIPRPASSTQAARHPRRATYLLPCRAVLSGSCPHLSVPPIPHLSPALLNPFDMPMAVYGRLITLPGRPIVSAVGQRVSPRHRGALAATAAEAPAVLPLAAQCSAASHGRRRILRRAPCPGTAQRTCEYVEVT